MKPMADNESYFARVLRVSLEPRNLAKIAVSAVLAGVGAFGYWSTQLKPLQQTAEVRYRSHMAMMRLIELQDAYFKAHATYANDLDSLLAGAPDAAKLRDDLKSSVDFNTLAVIGTAQRYRLEANVLDPERTAVKFRGTAPGR